MSRTGRAELSLRRRAMLVLLTEKRTTDEHQQHAQHGTRWIAKPYVTPLHNQEDNSPHELEQPGPIRSRHRWRRRVLDGVFHSVNPVGNAGALQNRLHGRDRPDVLDSGPNNRDRSTIVRRSDRMSLDSGSVGSVGVRPSRNASISANRARSNGNLRVVPRRDLRLRPRVKLSTRARGSV